MLLPEGLRCKALIEVFQETFGVSKTHAIVCIDLAVEASLIYKTPGLKILKK
jgi:hypothetical protein